MEKTQKKTRLQLEALESFYAEEKYPSRTAMECHATVFGLTYKQVRGWFVERRRREKRKRTASELLSARNGLGDAATSVSSQKTKAASALKCKKKKMKASIQRLQNPDYLLKKVFRKDGPPLGVEFDSLPSQALWKSTDSQNDPPTCKENQIAPKRGTVTKCAVTSHEEFNSSAPRKRHGARKDLMTVRKQGAGKDLMTVKRHGGGKDLMKMKKHGCGKDLMTMKKPGGGKGLMTVWRATNPDADARDFLIDMGLANGEVTHVSRKPQTRSRRLQQQKSVPKQGRLQSKLQEKRKRFVKRREVESNKDSNQKLPSKEKCELALEGTGSEEHLDKIAMLMDDEELELRELQARPISLGCLNHLTPNGDHGCSLCKDSLVKFPPSSVKMKQPFHLQPWDSSPEIVKKLFKVFHFLYTYAVVVDLSSFSLDEFAQAFHDKDSLLLGKIHVALLKLLLSHVQAELSSGSMPHLSKSCNFLAFIHWVENQKSTLEFWERSLNPLTWTEILRQVLVAAGFGSKQGAIRREALSKEMSLMVKYGLHSGTLKAELFKVLLVQGINGLKVSDLAKSLQIAELNVSSRIDDLESLISSTLSSDITLFEKISSSTYRVRLNSSEDEVEELQSDSEDSGAVDDDLSDSGICSSDDDSGCNSGNSNIRRLTHINRHRSKNNMMKVHTEIDESHPGEVWLLGLMEGEYSDLSIEEKLNSIVALVDLLHAGSTMRMEDPANRIAECIPNSLHSGSGAKIKRLSAKPHSVPRSSWVHAGNMDSVNKDHNCSKFHPIDSSLSISKFYEERYSTKGKDCGSDLHPMQSVFLGSDRRYSRYWLFLGPCNAYDPGHRRVYFESSEDGHWEVIDTEEALCALLSVLDDRGKREALLIESLEKRLTFLCQAMSNRMASSDGSEHLTQSDRSELDNAREDTYSPVSDVDNNSSETVNDSVPLNGTVVPEVRKKGEELKQKWKRIQAFDSWLWNSFYLDLNSVKHGKRSYFDTLTRCESCHDLYWRDEKHCRICHTTFELHFDLEEMFAIHVATCREKETSTTFPEHKVLSSQIQSLKAAIHAIESVMPEDALLGAWKKSAHKLWVKRLRRTSCLSELLQVLTDFVGAINEDWLYKCKIVQGSCKLGGDIIASFASMPHTTSAVALWLVKLDDLIAPHIKRACSERRQETSIRGKHPTQ
ncbi:putative transcription factor & chromatin remodeling DDT family [Rosa chinensis]|uniref:Putative transcription factor & chromatin remodeling DDT family n=1 Tax=Rosa chinensis TaxID=74649 RepID=A0A2P6RZC9_ROSCH|nr:homeobox-DDT domain protein RLT3 isoform X1 [Rosa chinensis]PRQ51784.1 putative transcription factor & chromatin remodeling DDT family [Rosa chinensis]